MIYFIVYLKKSLKIYKLTVLEEVFFKKDVNIEKIPLTLKQLIWKESYSSGKFFRVKRRI